MSTLKVGKVHAESHPTIVSNMLGFNTVNLYVGETKVIDNNSSTFAITGNVGIYNTAPRLGEK